MHTTNYFNTLIEVAEDCPVDGGTVPPLKGDDKSIARRQFEMLADSPYQYTSDEVIFGVLAQRKDYTEDEMDDRRKEFFSKGQACFRASPLTKRYGWGIHSDADGYIALYSSASEEYQRLAEDASVNKVKAMRSSRKK